MVFNKKQKVFNQKFRTYQEFLDNFNFQEFSNSIKNDLQEQNLKKENQEKYDYQFLWEFFEKNKLKSSTQIAEELNLELWYVRVQRQKIRKAKADMRRNKEI